MRGQPAATKGELGEEVGWKEGGVERMGCGEEGRITGVCRSEVGDGSWW